MINFKPIELEDKGIIEKYLATEQNMGCEMCFSSLYIWRKAYDMRYAVIEDCLVLWSKDGDNPAGLRFPDPGGVVRLRLRGGIPPLPAGMAGGVRL